MFEQITNLGIVSSLICTGKRTIKKGTNVIICVYRSVEFIPEIDFKYKFIDEAHHLEDETSVIKQKIDKIKAEKILRLSATFHSTEKLDYNFPMDIAIEKGYISDYIINVEYLTKGDKMKSIIDIVKNNMDWSPMFVYFNSTEKAIQFSKKLKAIGINAEYLTGEDSGKKRNTVRSSIENGNIQILGLCGMYNEGISINCIQTVLFADLRYSEVNRIQIAMRANRIYHSKPYYRIVLPICENDFSDDDLPDLIKTFSKIDRRLKESLRINSRSRIKIRREGEVISEEDAEILREEIFNRFGKMIDFNTEDKIKELLLVMENRDRPPPENKTLLFTNGQPIENFWKGCKINRKCDIAPFSQLLKNQVLKKDYDNYYIKKEAKKDIIFLTFDEKLIIFLDYVKKSKLLPKPDEKFSDETFMCGFWYVLREKLNLDKFSYILNQNPLIKSFFETYIKNKEKIAERELISPEEKVKEFIYFFNKNKFIPRQSDEYLFSDYSHMGNWWNLCKTRKKLESEPYNLLSTIDELKNVYDEFWRNREQKKNIVFLTKEEKIDELLEYVEKHKKIPTDSRKNRILFSDNTIMHDFWANIRGNGNIKLIPYVKLLSNKILADYYESYEKQKEENSKKIKLTIEEKVNIFLEKVIELNSIPPINKSICFIDGVCMGSFWSNIKLSGKYEKEPYNKLKLNKILENNIKEHLEHIEKIRKVGRLTIEQKVDKLLEFIEEKKRIPNNKENFTDSSPMISFIINATKEKRIKLLPYSKLLLNPILNNYYVSKKN